MKQLHPVLLTLLASILGTSCDLSTELELELPVEKRKLVANCLFSADSAWTVLVFSSEPALIFQEYDGHLVTNADIKISDGNNLIDFALDSSWWPCFRSTEGKAKTGDTYTLEVSAPGFETIRSSVTVPQPVPITSASSYRLPPDGEEPNVYERRIKITLADPPDVQNFYAVSIVEEYYDEVNPWPHRRVVNARPTDETLGDRFIPADFREFKASYLTPLFFDDRFFNGSEYTVDLGWRASTLFQQPQPKSFTYLIYLWSVSEEYYNYQVAVQKQKDQMTDPFAQPVQVPTNIENGFGVFGAYSQSQLILRNVE